MKVVTSFVTLAVLTLTFVVQLHGQLQCTFSTAPNPDGYVQLDVLENVPVGTVLGRYAAVGDVDGFDVDTENPEYFLFQYVGNELVLTLNELLSNCLDIGIEQLRALVTPVCGSEQEPLPVRFDLNIEDINNKPPVFNENAFSISMQTPWSLDVPINFRTPIFTTDDDFELENAETTFEVSDPRIRVVDSRVEYDQIPKFSYILELFVTDSLLPGVEELIFTITATNGDFVVPVEVTLAITKINVNSPLFSQNLYKGANVIETFPDLGDPVLLDSPIEANDPENSDFIYTVAGPQAHFVQIDTISGQLSFLEIPPGDVENLENGVAIIEVIARETIADPPLESTATVLLYFEIPEQAAENPPEFTQTVYKTVSIIEDLPNPGIPVELDATIEANDPEDSPFQYHLAGPQAHFVQIDAVSGQLSFLEIPPGDVEDLENRVAIIEVIARESAGTPPLESSATVLLYFEFQAQAAENPPEFTQVVYKTVNIIDDLPNPGSPVVLDAPIEANDPEDSPFQYHIAGPQAHYVEIDVSGQLSFLVIPPGDVENLENGVAIIEVIARESAGTPPLESASTVLLYFEIPGEVQPNENPPDFTQTIYKSASIIEDLPTPGTPVVLDATIEADDPEDSPFQYHIAGPQAYFVEIDAVSGQLSFLEIPPGDVENLENGVAIIEVVARESAGTTPLESSVTVLLYFEIPDDSTPDQTPDIIGFIIGIAILSVLFLVAVGVAIYFWHRFKKQIHLSNLIRVDDSGLSPSPVIERWADTKVDIGTTNSAPLDASMTSSKLYSPISNQPQAINSTLVGNGLSNGGHIIEPVVEEERVVERPPSPKPDYRMKPDYSVQIQDAVVVIPIESIDPSSSDSEAEEDPEDDIVEPIASNTGSGRSSISEIDDDKAGAEQQPVVIDEHESVSDSESESEARTSTLEAAQKPTSDTNSDIEEIEKNNYADLQKPVIVDNPKDEDGTFTDSDVEEERL